MDDIPEMANRTMTKGAPFPTAVVLESTTTWEMEPTRPLLAETIACCRASGLFRAASIIASNAYSTPKGKVISCDRLSLPLTEIESLTSSVADIVPVVVSVSLGVASSVTVSVSNCVVDEVSVDVASNEEDSERTTESVEVRAIVSVMVSEPMETETECDILAVGVGGIVTVIVGENVPPVIVNEPDTVRVRE